MAYSREQLISLVQDYAYGAGIDPAIAVAQAQRESGFNPNAVGSSGERGLMQFMPATWARFSDRPFDDAFDPNYNLTAWGNYMGYLLDLFDWDYSKALTGYNGGEGHLTNPGRYGPPSSAAQAYARDILAQANASGDIYYAVGDQQNNQGLRPSTQTSTYLLIGAVALFLLFAFKN